MKNSPAESGKKIVSDALFDRKIEEPGNWQIRHDYAELSRHIRDMFIAAISTNFKYVPDINNQFFNRILDQDLTEHVTITNYMKFLSEKSAVLFNDVLKMTNDLFKNFEKEKSIRIESNKTNAEKQNEEKKEKQERWDKEKKWIKKEKKKHKKEADSGSARLGSGPGGLFKT